MLPALQITNLSVSDFTVKENGINRVVTNVTCPSSPQPQVLSSVLVIDISGSMGDPPPSRLLLAQAAAKAWVQDLPVNGSECAITSFNELNFLNQDFTTDKVKLDNAIDSLSPFGGTDYSAALYNKPAGGIEIAKTGKYKRVIGILNKDGDPNTPPNANVIIQAAKDNNIAIYVVTLFLSLNGKDYLKQIAEQTGGQWFENVTTQDEAVAIYKKIMQLVTRNSYCSIEWQSGPDCSNSRNAVVSLNNPRESANVYYNAPANTISKL